MTVILFLLNDVATNRAGVLSLFVASGYRQAAANHVGGIAASPTPPAGITTIELLAADIHITNI